ncbi:PPE domain-containing protein [Saccharopolyspora sp. ASAGF58]|uniref:PPE domain-containing protein n=1 Tax=Saccharopolyspora sp. ASAGF58 TaxID=2719023 RepID=UPI00143FF6FF|nr:PPE domain-containing protein [Saccharopolyspora sp. ASAGF58]QIZ35926.1 PPE domain-containing protein [Saccharopolyspora sp. ASAGF58]
MWPFSQPKKIEGQAQAAFDHPKIHRELNGGVGVSPLSIAAGNLSGQFTARLRRVDELVQGAIGRCNKSWTGSASEAMTQESSPFRNVVQQSEELSAALAKGVEDQGGHFSRTKNTMPAPHNVPPLDLSFSDLAPTNLGMKLAGQEIHESKHNEAEQKAREDYTAYRTSSNSTVQSLQPYPAVPASVADVGVAETQRPNSVDPSTNYSGTSSSTAVSGARTPRSDSTAPIPSGNEPGAVQPERPSAPAESGSAWANPASPTPGTVQPPSAGTNVPPAGGIGVGMVPGTGGTPGSGTGRGIGRGGSGVGTRGGPGVGGGRGALGLSGPSTSGGPGTSAAGARSGAGALGGAAGPGQRGRSEDDQEHERKYVKNTDEHFVFEPEIDAATGQVIAPAVLGDERPDTSPDKDE